MSLGVIILVAIGGTMALEGFVWAVFPAQMRRSYEEGLRLIDDKSLHVMGLVCVAIGVAVIGAAVKFGTL